MMESDDRFSTLVFTAYKRGEVPDPADPDVVEKKNFADAQKKLNYMINEPLFKKRQ